MTSNLVLLSSTGCSVHSRRDPATSETESIAHVPSCQDPHHDTVPIYLTVKRLNRKVQSAASMAGSCWNTLGILSRLGCVVSTKHSWCSTLLVFQPPLGNKALAGGC